MIRLIALFACMPLLIAPSESAPPDGTYQLEVTSPDEGEVVSYHSWSPGIAIKLRAPAGDYEVELYYAGVVHHMLALRNRARVLDGGRLEWNLYDRFIQPVHGSEPVQLRLKALGGAGVGGSGELLMEHETLYRFEIADVSSLEERAVELAKGVAGQWIHVAQTLDPKTDPYPPYGLEGVDAEQGLALGWMAKKHDWIWLRVYNLTQLGEAFSYADRPGDALGLFRMAEAIYEDEGTAMLKRGPVAHFPARWTPQDISYAPEHWQGLAEFHARRAQLDQAMSYLKKELEYYQDQARNHPSLDADDRTRCWERVANQMGVIGDLNYYLRRDRVSYDLWWKKSKEARARVPERNGPLLGE